MGQLVLGFRQVLAAFFSPHFRVWFNRFAGYFSGRVCGLMANCAPKRSRSPESRPQLCALLPAAGARRSRGAWV